MEGEGAHGPIVSEPVTVTDVYVKDNSEVVVSSLGKEEVSRSTVWLPIDQMPANGSKVTVWAGTESEYTGQVFRTARLDHPHWPNFGKVWLR